MVMTEDTQTLLDAAIAVLQELADVYAADTVDEDFKPILYKLNGLMSDRASVNKSFNKAMNKKRCDVLGDEPLQLEFVYCSAHFLLGLSCESEKAMVVSLVRGISQEETQTSVDSSLAETNVKFEI